jgi:hypothetical protein
MPTRRSFSFPLLFAFLAGVLILSGCSDDPVTDPLVGLWNVTSFSALGSDFIADGMSLHVLLTAADTYTLDVIGDLVGICGESETDCSSTGAYTSTTAQITLDPDTEDVTTFDYTIQGSTMTWTGDIDGNPVTIAMSRVQNPGSPSRPR